MPTSSIDDLLPDPAADNYGHAVQQAILRLLDPHGFDGDAAAYAAYGGATFRDRLTEGRVGISDTELLEQSYDDPVDLGIRLETRAIANAFSGLMREDDISAVLIASRRSWSSINAYAASAAFAYSNLDLDPDRVRNSGVFGGEFDGNRMIFEEAVRCRNLGVSRNAFMGVIVPLFPQIANIRRAIGHCRSQTQQAMATSVLDRIVSHAAMPREFAAVPAQEVVQLCAIYGRSLAERHAPSGVTLPATAYFPGAVPYDVMQFIDRLTGLGWTSSAVVLAAAPSGQTFFDHAMASPLEASLAAVRYALHATFIDRTRGVLQLNGMFTVRATLLSISQNNAMTPQQFVQLIANEFLQETPGSVHRTAPFVLRGLRQVFGLPRDRSLDRLASVLEEYHSRTQLPGMSRGALQSAATGDIRPFLEEVANTNGRAFADDPRSATPATPVDLLVATFRNTGITPADIGIGGPGGGSATAPRAALTW